MIEASEDTIAGPIDGCRKSTMYLGKVVYFDEDAQYFQFRGYKGAPTEDPTILDLTFYFPGPQPDLDLGECCKRRPIRGGTMFEQPVWCAQLVDPLIRHTYLKMIVRFAKAFDFDLRVLVFDNQPTSAYSVHVYRNEYTESQEDQIGFPVLGRVYGPYKVWEISSPMLTPQGARPTSLGRLSNGYNIAMYADDRQDDISLHNYASILKYLRRKTELYFTFVDSWRIKSMFVAPGSVSE